MASRHRPDAPSEAESPPISPLREEWIDAGWASRTLFVTGGIYWIGMTALFLVTLLAVAGPAEALLVFGFYYVPLFYAFVLRGLYVLFWPSRRRPRLVSLWLLVIGAMLGILFTVARVAVPAP